MCPCKKCISLAMCISKKVVVCDVLSDYVDCRVDRWVEARRTLPNMDNIKSGGITLEILDENSKV